MGHANGGRARGGSTSRKESNFERGLQGEEGEQAVWRIDSGELGRDSQAGGPVFEGAGHQHESEKGSASPAQDLRGDSPCAGVSSG
jgi:hypothetical protein